MKVVVFGPRNGFTEALITDLRINAPHIKCSVVMPGQIGTSARERFACRGHHR
jgi:hypothetical protein